MFRRLILLSIFTAIVPLHKAHGQIAGAATRLSQTAAGAGGDGVSGHSSISPTGKLAVFESGASNLVPKDRNNAADIFACQYDTGKIRLASVGRKGIQGNGSSSDPQVSPQTPNGAYVIAYSSDASNLARSVKRPDNNGFQDIFATIFPKRSTVRITRAMGGGAANGRSESPGVALLAEPNRLFFVYGSKATNLTADDTNDFTDIYLSRLTAPSDTESTDLEDRITTVRVSKSAIPGAETDGDSQNARISGDGRFIVFTSDATNLINGVVTSGRQVYLHTISTGTTELISKATDGTPGDANSRAPVINYSGRFVVYITSAMNILSDGITVDPSAYQVVRYDTVTGLHDRVNVTANRVAGNGQGVNLGADIDASGRFVFFSDRADNLVENDANGFADVFVKDMGTGLLERVSRSTTGGDPDAGSAFPAVNRTDFTSLTGVAVFSSGATNLIASDTEGAVDLFLVPLTFTPLPLSADTRLEVPPSVSLGSTSARLTFEQFSGPVFPASGAVLPRASSDPQVRYKLKYHRLDSNGKKVDRKQVISRRNTISVRNLSPGTYVSSYKAEVTQSGSVVSSTPFSPRQRFTVS